MVEKLFADRVEGLAVSYIAWQADDDIGPFPVIGRRAHDDAQERLFIREWRIRRLLQERSPVGCFEADLEGELGSPLGLDEVFTVLVNDGVEDGVPLLELIQRLLEPLCIEPIAAQDAYQIVRGGSARDNVHSFFSSGEGAKDHHAP
jgi:hypothetical protein